MFGPTEKLIAYIIEHLSGKITKTQLVKLAYLADLESTKFTNSQVSDIQWLRYHYGPYDKHLDERLGFLQQNGFIEIKQQNKVSDPDKTYFIFNYTGKSVDPNLEPVKKDIVDTIIKQFGSFTLNSLLKYVYDTEPMKGAKKDEPLDLKKIVKMNAA